MPRPAKPPPAENKMAAASPASHAVEEMDATDITTDKQSAPLLFLHDDVFAKITLQNILQIIHYKVPLSEEALRQVTPENLRACVTSGQLHAIRGILKSRYLIDSMVNDMSYQRQRLNLDNSDTVDAKILQFAADNTSEVLAWVSATNNYLTNCKELIYLDTACTNLYDDIAVFPAASPDFITVKPTKRRRQNAPPTKSKLTTQELALHNKFSSLTVANEDNNSSKNINEEEETITTTKISPPTSNNNHNSNQNKKPNKQNSKKNTPKHNTKNTTQPETENPNIKPIMITKPSNIIEFMKKINLDLKIKLTCKITNQYIKIEPDNEELHRMITSYLDEKNIPYYIIMPKILRPVKIVIRGHPIDTNPEQIKSELTAMNYQIANIYQLKKRDQDRTPMPLFQVQLHPTENIETIWDLDSLLYMRIKVEKYNITGGIAQCHRCQKFGHSSINCRLTARCVKCAGEHLTSECPTQRTDAPLCVNCNGKHPASYRGCPNFPKLNQTKTPATTTNNTFQPKYTHSNLSFANVVNQNTTNTPIINNTPNSTLNSLQELAQDNELLLILQILHKIAPQIKQATSMQQKMLIVLNAFNM
ncbi:nucleic-acid-binding protein from transposon X-element [Caerostris darwini]|uniref:Nucleic-acid-binding protein from transposon X-element n=1 Tax=Caerostris darwini TaxID=1538125 RepID=A0AAV4RQ04_9ARAC|nr:nucleic-acid-binding protein from transposon X-element [Caerostris darwini]